MDPRDCRTIRILIEPAHMFAKAPKGTFQAQMIARTGVAKMFDNEFVIVICRHCRKNRDSIIGVLPNKQVIDGPGLEQTIFHHSKVHQR